MRATAIAGLIGATLTASPATAQTVEQFYAGRQVNIVVGFDPGGAYDPYARAVARHSAAAPAGLAHLRDQEHAGRRQRHCRQSSVQRGPARRLGARRHRRRRRARAGLRQEERAIRRAALRLARQRQRGDRRLPRLAHDAVQDGRGSVQAGDDHRRVGRVESRISHSHEHGARNKDEARARLPRPGQHPARARTRRSAGHVRHGQHHRRNATAGLAAR